MAYVNMSSNNEQQQQASLMYSSSIDPRISFSIDFVDTRRQQTATRHDQMKYKEAPVSSDFEFNVENYGMIPADEIFFNGVLLPLKNEMRRVTLREELSVGDVHDDDGESDNHMVSKGFSWWKLGLKSKKDHKKNGSAQHVHDQGDEVLVANKTQNSLAMALECEERRTTKAQTTRPKEVKTAI